MADMKPVAWKHTVIRDNVITHDPADIRTHPEHWISLFSADQLKQAKVEVLREAAEKVDSCGYLSVEELNRMAEAEEST